ncbi:flap endonuclease-1 [Candidatus Woesearchaeota archaeon]|nr:flap endonuclease-1 [Candidatus Woesearchaeota archaeon]
MGVAITELLPKKEITLQELYGKKLAVDSSNVLYQFLASIRQQDGTPLMDNQGNITSHLMGLSTRIPNLMEQGIKLCFVFDGKPPEMKYRESRIREERKEIAETKYQKAKEERDIDSMSKYSKQTIRLTKEIREESKEFIKALGLPIIQAHSEAEAQAAFLAEQGDVYAIVSQDTDSLLYSAPRLIRNLTVSQRRKVKGTYIKVNPEVIELKEVLSSLNINQDQLLALSILVGTDYNPGGVHRIGPKTALKLVQQYKDFDTIFSNVQAEFNWKKVYATFKNMPIIKNYRLKWTEPDYDKLTNILEKHDFAQERINKLMERLQPKKQKNLDKWFN